MSEKSHKFGLRNEDIAKINTVFKTHKIIGKVIVYGSRAKGNFKPESDIDLTILSSDADLTFLLKLQNDIDDLLLPYKVDLSIYSLLENDSLKDHINRVGLSFYDSKK